MHDISLVKQDTNTSYILIVGQCFVRSRHSNVLRCCCRNFQLMSPTQYYDNDSNGDGDGDENEVTIHSAISIQNVWNDSFWYGFGWFFRYSQSIPSLFLCDKKKVKMDSRMVGESENQVMDWINRVWGKKRRIWKKKHHTYALLNGFSNIK